MKPPSKYKNKIVLGDAATVLKEMPEEIVDLGITSPPYNKQEIIWDRTIAGNIRGWRFWLVGERKTVPINPKKIPAKGGELSRRWKIIEKQR